MTVQQAALAFVQQAQADGLEFSSFAPIKVTGPEPQVRWYSETLSYLRKRGQEHAHKLDFDRFVAAAGKTRLTPMGEALLPLVGEMVWTNDRYYVYGMLEAVCPGLALVTPRPELPLPGNPIDRWNARTARALPFALENIESPDFSEPTTPANLELQRLKVATTRPRRWERLEPLEEVHEHFEGLL